MRQVAVSPRTARSSSAPTATATSFISCTCSTRPRASPSRSPTSRRCSTSSGPGRSPRTARGSRTRRTPKRRRTSRSGFASWAPGHAQRVRGGDVCLCRRLVARGHKAAGHRHPQQQRHVDPPDRPRIGRDQGGHPHDEDGIYAPGPWAADGSGFYLLTDEGREFRGSRSTTSPPASSGSRLPTPISTQ